MKVLFIVNIEQSCKDYSLVVILFSQSNLQQTGNYFYAKLFFKIELQTLISILFLSLFLLIQVDQKIEIQEVHGEEDIIMGMKQKTKKTEQEKVKIM